MPTEMPVTRNPASSIGKLDGEHDEQHAQHIYEQVVSIDELASVLVGQETADYGTKGGTQAVGADEIKPSEMHFGEAEVFLPQRQAAGAGNDSTGIQIVGQRDGDGAV